MTVSDIIRLFVTHPQIGSMSDLAKLVGVPVTTMSSWKTYNQIPSWRQAKILELAAQYGIDLSATDFPPPEARVKAA